jgi:phospholipid-binding lipoprotein MlaA
MVITTAACGRGPPAPSADASLPASAAEAPEPQLAGGPRPDSPIVTTELPPPPGAAVETADASVPLTPAAVMPAAVAPEGLANAPARIREGAAGEIPDPLQRLNRPMFRVDQTMRRVVLAKFSGVQGPTPPRPVQQGLGQLGQAIRNLDEPTTLANQALQRKPVKALRTAARFLINSTLGVAGLFDVASKFGLKPARADFGQTLASYGVGPGAYIYVPIRGPTSARDVAAALVDTYFWPLHWVRVGWGVNQGIVLARLETQPKSDPGFRYASNRSSPPAVDPYVQARRDYARKRDDEIHDRVPTAQPVLAGGPALDGSPQQLALRPHRKITLASAS